MALRKRILCVMTAAAAFLSACSAGNDKSAEENEDKLYTYTLNMYKTYDGEYAEGDNTEFNKLLRERFGIKFKYDRADKADRTAKINACFQSGDSPDIIMGCGEDMYKTWADKGYLAAIDYTKLTSWCGLWGDDLQKVIDLAQNDDEKLYYLPEVNRDKIKMCWMYRKDVFDDLDIEFPSSTDEFLKVCAKLKEKYPDNAIIAENSDKDNILAGIFQAFWLRADILSENSCLDPKSGEFIPYAMSEDNAREMLKFLNTLYNEGFIGDSIFPGNKNMTQKCEDNAFITYGYILNEDTPYTISENMLTYDEKRGTIFKEEPLYTKSGIAFGADLGDNEDKFESVLKFYDWCASDEGQLYTSYGIEGKSDDMLNNQPKVKSGWYHEKTNPNGKRISEEFGIIPYIFVQHPKLHEEVFTNKSQMMYKAYTEKNNYYSFEDIPMRYNKEEKERYTEFETALSIKRDEYMERFIKGEENPDDDSAWARYIEELNKVGLMEFCKLQKSVYEKSN